MITVIYYTSNREKESFEQKIREKLLDSIGDLPLVSISQKPIDFGENICIGDIGCSDRNIYKQILLGCRKAVTPLIALAEADCLYPPGYFDFRPENIDTAYYYSNLWVLWKGRSVYKRKNRSLCALISGREYLIYCLKRRKRRPGVKGIFWKDFGWGPFGGKLPVVTIKTKEGMRWKTWTDPKELPVSELPYWGSAVDINKELEI